ncbi:MAG: hypothetical protein HC914_13840 [Chloroflexaceae bacterium]|nr:hypothetical protein [Chloroflexaceae bacterium]
MFLVLLLIAVPLIFAAQQQNSNTQPASVRGEPQDKAAEPTPPQPSATACNTAIKLLTQYERLLNKQNRNLTQPELARLNSLRDTGQITMHELPGRLHREFPGEFIGLTLQQIRTLCGQ